MIEQANEIVRRFNRSPDESCCGRSRPMLADVGRLPGPDGKAR
jgi:hypothetical protein